MNYDWMYIHMTINSEIVSCIYVKAVARLKLNIMPLLELSMY